MQVPLALQRVTQLCDSLASDGTLRGELLRAGFSKHHWKRLVNAIRRGESDSLIPLLDVVEAAAAAAGIDGVTTVTRQYRPLPGHGSWAGGTRWTHALLARRSPAG